MPYSHRVPAQGREVHKSWPSQCNRRNAWLVDGEALKEAGPLEGRGKGPKAWRAYSQESHGQAGGALLLSSINRDVPRPSAQPDRSRGTQRSRGVAVRAHELHGVAAADDRHWTTANHFRVSAFGQGRMGSRESNVLAMAGTLGRRVGPGSGATGGASPSAGAEPVLIRPRVALREAESPRHRLAPRNSRRPPPGQGPFWAFRGVHPNAS
jgi:hypothetical protein